MLRQSKKAISLLHSLGQKEKILLCLYGYAKGSRIQKADVARVLATDIWHEIPEDAKAATESINQGILLAQAFPHSSAAKSCQEAVNKLIESRTVERKKGFGRMKRKQK